MSSEDNETNGRPGDEEDENEELEDETEDESEGHVSEEIAARGRTRASERETAETREDERLRDWLVLAPVPWIAIESSSWVVPFVVR